MNIFTGVLDLIYPVVCIHCGISLVKTESLICSFCNARLPQTHFHKDPVNEMTRAMWGRANIEFATAFLFFKKAGITQGLLHQLKYKGRKEVGIQFGNRFGSQLIENPFISHTDYLIPVPLHSKKLRARGYNQSKIICDGMNSSLNIPVLENLHRISYTDTQTRKRRFDRWLNVSEKFILTNQDMLENKRVLLVDDVFTTGATVEACCKVLESVKGISIGIATLAIALK
jgi:competence protein ComFC